MNAAAKKSLKEGAAAVGIELTAEQMATFELFAEELKKWNKRINLTAIFDDQGIAVKHFVDSLTVLKVVDQPGMLLDIGSGGGFPCIPVKIVAPECKIVSVDAVVKKISFQKQATRLLGFTDFTALHERAEALPGQYAEAFDWIVSRAFSDIPTFVSLALPLLKVGGKIVAMKGPEGRKEAEAAEAALAAMGATVERVEEFSLPGTGDGRSLVVIGRAS